MNKNPFTDNLEQWLRSKSLGCAPQTVLADGAAIGPYRVLGLLGRGGNAEVYRAAGEDGSIVALKVPRHRDNAAAVERFRREIRLLREQPHKAFPRLVDSGESDGLPWMAMEELFPCERPRTARAVARHLASLCEGLGHLHALGLVHRDIKPANILCRADGSPVLIDFGLVKKATKEESFPTIAGSLSVSDGQAVGHGTPGWAAPEQFSGDDISPAADVYALGMLALSYFDGHPPRLWRPLLRQATSPLPADRPRDAAAFATALRRRRWPVVGTVLAALAVAAVAGGIWGANRPASVPKKPFPATSPVRFVFAPALAEQLGWPPSGWLTSPDKPWEIDPDIDGAIRSNGFGGTSTSVLSIPVDGPSRVFVRYRRHFAGTAILPEGDPNPGSFFTVQDGEKVLLLDDEGDADADNPLGEERTATLALADGPHRLEFVYQHNGTGYIDQFNGVRIVSLRVEK